jgi:UDP-N-acetylglucosamine acyltransferase
VSIHPTALVHPDAKLGAGVEVGAYSVIGPHVVLGDRCRVHHHATIEGYTTLGEECEVFPQAVLGMPPQDLKFSGERTTLEIGRRNIFREMVTIHPGTGNGGGVTRIGDGNLLLIGVHVAHDCRIGSGCVIANYVQFAGHVHVEDRVNMGGHSAVHHFVTVGRHAFVGGMTRVSADVPPYMVVVAARGTRSEVRMVNGVGLQRSGFSAEDVDSLKDAFMRLYSRRARQSTIPIAERVQEILDGESINPHVDYLCKFLLRSFGHGRNGRYLESLRPDPVHRKSWKLDGQQTQPVSSPRLTIHVEGNGLVRQSASESPVPGVPAYELTAQANEGSIFTGWNGDFRGASNPIRVTLEADKTVTAMFAGK